MLPLPLARYPDDRSANLYRRGTVAFMVEPAMTAATASAGPGAGMPLHETCSQSTVISSYKLATTLSGLQMGRGARSHILCLKTL